MHVIDLNDSFHLIHTSTPTFLGDCPVKNSFETIAFTVYGSNFMARNFFKELRVELRK